MTTTAPLRSTHELFPRDVLLIGNSFFLITSIRDDPIMPGYEILDALVFCQRLQAWVPATSITAAPTDKWQVLDSGRFPW